ncbi:hypothetical protein ACFLX3_02230 [Chloroflexota bacterium]
MSNLKKLFWEDKLERSEYFVTNKVVKISEALGGRLPLGWCRFTKSYIEGDFDIELWFRLTSPKGDSYDFLAVFTSTASVDSHRDGRTILKGIHQSSVRQLNSLSSPTRADSCAYVESNYEDRCPMFIIIPEAIENPERMRVWFAPSFVWLVGLKTSKNVYSRLRNAIELYLPSVKGTGRESQVSQFTFRAPRKIPKMPNEIVQNGAEVVDTIPCDETQPQWRLFPTLQLNPQELVGSITIFLGYHFIWPVFNKPSGLTLKVIHVLPCSEKTQTYLLKVGGHE